MVPGKCEDKRALKNKAPRDWDRSHMDFVTSYKLGDAKASLLFKEKLVGVRVQPRNQRTELSFKTPRQKCIFLISTIK